MKLRNSEVYINPESVDMIRKYSYRPCIYSSVRYYTIAVTRTGTNSEYFIEYKDNKALRDTDFESFATSIQNTERTT